MQTHPDIPDPVVPRGDLGNLPPTLEWTGGVEGALTLVDQTVLPHEVTMRTCRTVEDVWEAIRVLRVRGAPAIGVAAAYGLCLGTRDAAHATAAEFADKLERVGEYLCECRPTAVNLAWAVRRVTDVARQHEDPAQAWAAMLAEAHAMAVEDAETCRAIGEVGAELVPDGGGVLTHCNAGALATVAWGTALSVMYVAHERGRRFKVYADETRPLLQGARLTAYELAAAGLDVTILCDGAAASLLRSGRVDLVVTGADRIAANGDTANKIGTYSVALAAQAHGVPFYVAAPLSTFDLSVASGDEIPIEERPDAEVRGVGARVHAAAEAGCYNPAFDVTPAEMIAGIITERGLLKPVTTANIKDIFAKGG